ncbi:MAG: hypothetical protein ACKVY0_00500 [Prosthecobacter sp.]|uniref:hypothetical protein n=1 Tax=Prosthecobacter sp. TaxID=1965333 RepID=UPI0038FD7587
MKKTLITLIAAALAVSIPAAFAHGGARMNAAAGQDNPPEAGPGAMHGKGKGKGKGKGGPGRGGKGIKGGMPEQD